MDLVVKNKIVMKIKSVDTLHDIHLAQILTYLKLSNNKVGLFVNFNSLKLIDRIKRVNKY